MRKDWRRNRRMTLKTASEMIICVDMIPWDYKYFGLII